MCESPENPQDLPSAAELARMSETQVIDLIVKSGQPGNSALAEMHRRTSEHLVRAVKDFDRASRKQGDDIHCLTVAVLAVALMQLVLLSVQIAC